jgi:hypothetical protein
VRLPDTLVLTAELGEGVCAAAIRAPKANPALTWGKRSTNVRYGGGEVRRRISRTSARQVRSCLDATPAKLQVQLIRA